MMEHFDQAQQQIDQAVGTVHVWTNKLFLLSSGLGVMRFVTIDTLYSSLGCISLLMIMVINYPRFKKRVKEIWSQFRVKFKRK